MLHLKTRWLFLITLWLWVATGQAADIAGYVTRFKNAVAVENATGRRPLALGEPLHLGDRVVTGAEARLEARMRDSTVLTLGENTEFVIQQVQGVTPNKDGSLFELLKGVFRAVTAQTDVAEQPQDYDHLMKLLEKAVTAQTDVAEQPREHWQVRTPVATIGIRGTELWGGFNLLDAGSNTLDVVMLAGRGVFVENAGQRVELKQAGAGTTVKGAGQAPTPIQVWGEKKLQAAQQTVAW